MTCHYINSATDQKRERTGGDQKSGRTSRVQQEGSLNIKGAGIDRRLITPLYHQIYVVLRDKIYDGTYADGDRLPSEHELSAMYEVSRITAKRALDELAAAGFVVRERGRGTRVNFAAPAPAIRSSVEGLIENLLAMGLKTKVELLDFAYVDPSAEVARALRCDPGAKVQRAVRVRRLEGAPFSHLTTFVPEDVGRSYNRRELRATPMLALLERSGVVISSAEQTISATLADPKVAPLLEVEVGSPLLRISRIVSNQPNRQVEYITGLYRPDRYQYSMTLSRVNGARSRAWSPVA
jgi:GntR family transcriptional regulator